MASNDIGSFRKETISFTAERFYDGRIPVPFHRLSQSGRRLLWHLQGPLRSAISVMGEDCNPDGPREPYIHGNDRHPISNDPITEQPMIIVVVIEKALDDWEDEWWDHNYERVGESILPTPEDLPQRSGPLLVTASNGEFVSVHDYVSVVHLWLMKRREKILQARHVADPDYVPGAFEEKLLVSVHDAEVVDAGDEEEVLQMLREIFESNKRREGNSRLQEQEPASC